VSLTGRKTTSTRSERSTITARGETPGKQGGRRRPCRKRLGAPESPRRGRPRFFPLGRRMRRA
jgi:hypothetical protein